MFKLVHPKEFSHKFRLSVQFPIDYDVNKSSSSRFRFMVVLVCLIFSVLSTIEEYEDFANETLFWMVPFYMKIINLLHFLECC